MTAAAAREALGREGGGGVDDDDAKVMVVSVDRGQM